MFQVFIFSDKSLLEMTDRCSTGNLPETRLKRFAKALCKTRARRKQVLDQPSVRLDDIHALQLLQHVHGAQLPLIEAGLILVHYDEHVVVAAIELPGELLLPEPVHAGLRIVSVQPDLPRERHQCRDALVALFRDIILKCLPVRYGVLPRRSDDHGL